MLARYLLLALLGAGLADLARGQIYSTDFSDLGGWTVTTGGAPGYEWDVDATPNEWFGPYQSPPASLNFNDGVDIGGGSFGVHTWGWATSPPIDLSVATGTPHLRFAFLYVMEDGCDYDRVSLRVRPAGGGTALLEELCLLPPPEHTSDGKAAKWYTYDYALDAAWGAVEVEFTFDSMDPLGNDGAGPFIDDLVVFDSCGGYWSTICAGEIRLPGPLPSSRLAAVGSFSVTDNDLSLEGAAFYEKVFTLAFVGSQPAPMTHQGYCLNPMGASRLTVASTGSTGTPIWNVDLTAPPPLGVVALPGSTWYFQAVYRQGTSVLFSDGIRVTFCP